MANVTGHQPDIKFCPICKGEIDVVRREDMVSSGYKRVGTGMPAEHTHTYQCQNDPQHKFEINQARPPNPASG